MIDVNHSARALADRYWEELLDLEPLIGTMMGDERFDDRLSDPSEEGVAHKLEMNRRAVAEVSAIDRSALDETARTTLATLQAIAMRLVAEAEHRLDRFYAVSHLFGPGTLLAELGSLQRADTPERVDRYVRRLGRVPKFLDDLGAVALGATKVGQTSPGVVVDRCIGQIERLLRTPIEETPAFGPLADGDESGRERVEAVLRDEVWPAFERYLDVLRRYRPSATETIGLYALPNGDALYAATILSYTTLALDSREVHDIGVAGLEKIQAERREISRALGYGDDVDRAVAQYTDTGSNNAATREEMVEIARRQVQKGWDAAPGWFGRLPSVNCEVRPVEEFREQDTPGAYYQPPTADNSRPGVYYINTSDLGERPLHHVATTTYHEANPGHHFQITLEQEHPDRPALRRFGGIFAGSAFAEGWGLYSERLADQMGLFENEYERLGMLEAQAWRACRLIVDTGIHALKWDRDRSIAKMMEGGVPKLDSEIEVDRYIANPGQALAYKIGQIEIENQRDAAAAREGAAFSLRSFHDHLLALGSLPLPALRAELARGDG